MMSQTLMSQTVLPARSSLVFGSPVKAAAPSRTQVDNTVQSNPQAAVAGASSGQCRSQQRPDSDHTHRCRAEGA